MTNLVLNRPRLTAILLSVLRLIAAFLLMAHGTQKLFGFPPPGKFPDAFTLIWFAGVIECFGGALLLVGFFTRPVAFVLCGFMAFAYFIGHAGNGFLPLVNRGELAVLYCFVFLYIAAAGGGAWSVDSWLAGRVAQARRAPVTGALSHI